MLSKEIKIKGASILLKALTVLITFFAVQDVLAIDDIEFEILDSQDLEESLDDKLSAQDTALIDKTVDMPNGMTLKDGPLLRGQIDQIRRNIIKGAEYKIYTFDEYQQLGRLVRDYKWLYGYAQNLELKLSLQYEIVYARDEIDIAIEEKTKMLIDSKEFVKKMYDSEVEKNKRLQRDRMIVQTMLISGVVVETVVIVVLSVFLAR